MDSLKYELRTAILEGCLERVKSLINEHPHLMRSDISGHNKGWTPLHYAAKSEEIGAFLIKEERRRSEEGMTGTPSYNIQDKNGNSPAFISCSYKLIEMMLQFEDLQLLSGKGKTLLWRCAERNLVSEKVAWRLRDQLGQRYVGPLPLEKAFEMSHLQSFVQLVKALEYCSTGINEVNFGQRWRGRLVLEKVLVRRHGNGEWDNTEEYVRLIFTAIKKCPPTIKAMNLRALSNHGAWLPLREIFRDTGDLIVQWVNDNETGLGEEESVRLMAMVMEARGDKKWYDPTKAEHRKVLWSFCCTGSLTLVQYLKTLDNIMDPVMDDGTTGFSMALARQDVQMMLALLTSNQPNGRVKSSYPPSGVDPKELARRAIIELCINPCTTGTKLIETLISILECHNISLRAPQNASRLVSEEIIGLNMKFPMQNQMTERNCQAVKKIYDEIERKATQVTYKCKVKNMRDHILHDLCLNMHEKSIPTIKVCHHTGVRRTSCMMAQELVRFTEQLQDSISFGPMKDMGPFFELVGSIAEGTRIGLANELDLALKFKAWLIQPPFKVEGDPFSLKKSENIPKILEQFFEGQNFQFHKFMYFILSSVEKAVEQVFTGKNSLALRRVTTNEDWSRGVTPCNGDCKKNLKDRNFQQCQFCTVTVSQTKSGVALQLEYVNPDSTMGNIYTSIDLIPVFHIAPINAIDLAKLIMGHMLGEHPPEGWLNFMFKYASDYKVIQEISESVSKKITSVGLKTMNFYIGRNHYIKPAQELTDDKFSSLRMRHIYSYIKFLNKVLHLGFSSYWVKKELMKPEYQSILDSCTENRNNGTTPDDFALIHVLMQPEFRTRFETKIDFQRSQAKGFICLV